MAKQDKKFRCTVGFSKTQAIWTETVSMTFDQLIEKFSEAKISNSKDGPCMVPALFSGKRRQAKDVKSIDMLFLDSDNGQSLEELENIFRKAKYAVIIHSTYSHNSKYSTVSKKAWEAFKQEHGHNPQLFLKTKKGLLPHIIENAKVHAQNDTEIIFEHKPCPKYRIILPLARSFSREDYSSQNHFLNDWKARVKTLVDSWGLSLDQTCFEAARLFFDPRRPEKSPPFERWVMWGEKYLNIYDVKPSDTAVATAANTIKFKGEALFNHVNLLDWYHKNGRKFDFYELIKDKVPEILTSRVSEDRHHFLCPFRDQHTKHADDPSKEGDTFVRSPRGDPYPFTIYCSHNACQERHTVDFIRGMLENEWIELKDLYNATYNMRIKDFDVLSDEEVEDLIPDENSRLELIDLSTWDREPEQREWILDQWIPRGYVTALYGAGGTGKSLLAQQLMTCLATGLPFLGIDVSKMKTLGIFCEDDAQELHRRQYNINNSMFIDHSDLSKGFNIISRLGHDNLLMYFDRNNEGKRTEFWEKLLKTAQELEVDLIVIDTAADVFGGNENDRPQVRQFVQSCLGRLAQLTGGAVLLLAHPAKTGDAGYSGSTAWDATVRSRIYLERRDEEDLSSNFRFMVKKKANYSTIDDEIKMEYVNGYMTMRHKVSSVEVEPGESREALIEKIASSLWLFIRTRNTQRQPVSHHMQSPNSVFKAAKMDKAFIGIKMSFLKQALQWLIANECISLDMPIYQRDNRHWARGIRCEKHPSTVKTTISEEEILGDD